MVAHYGNAFAVRSPTGEKLAEGPRGPIDVFGVTLAGLVTWAFGDPGPEMDALINAQTYAPGVSARSTAARALHRLADGTPPAQCWEDEAPAAAEPGVDAEAPAPAPDALGTLLDAAYSALEEADRANAAADEALDAVREHMDMGSGDGGTFDEAMAASRFDRAEAIAMLAREGC